MEKDRSDVVGDLIGYDCDELYHIYAPKIRDAIVSHDIILHKTVGDCNDKIKQPVKLEKMADIQEDQNVKEKATNESRSNTMRDTNEPEQTADKSSGSDGDDSKLFTDPAGQLGKENHQLARGLHVNEFCKGSSC